MTNPNPSHFPLFDQMDPTLFERVLQLADSPSAQIIASGPASPELQKAAQAYVKAAQASGLPPELWRVLTDRGPWRRLLYAPLPLIFIYGLNSAKAVEMLANAGCSLFHSEWAVWSKQPSTAKDHTVLPAADIALRLFSGSDSAMRRAVLSAFLSDPLAPADSGKALQLAYDAAVSGSSKTSKGVLGPGDKLAKAVCSLVCAASVELIQASKRPGWEGLDAICEDASERLAAKKDAPIIQTPEALKKTLTRDQRARLDALGLLIRKYPMDAELINAALDATAWLKATPNLACVIVSSHGSLLGQALLFGSPAALDWLESAGANPWLASAQSECPDACHWAVTKFAELSPAGADCSTDSIARMLLRGAWLDGSPEPKERCVALAQTALGNLAQEKKHESWIKNARALLSSMEKISLDELTAPKSADGSAPTRKTPPRAL